MPVKRRDYPTSTPTSQPSFRLENYQNNRGYRNYIASQQALTSDSVNGVQFSSFYYKGSYLEGPCDGWDNYLNSYLQLPYDNAFFSKAAITFEFYDIKARKSRRDAATCDKPAALAGMVAAIKSGQDFENNCNGRSWRVYSCGATPLICIDCKRSCERSEACPRKNLYLNPCQQGCPSVYLAIGINIQFTYAFIPQHPLFIEPLNVTASKAFVDVRVNVTKVGSPTDPNIILEVLLSLLLPLRISSASALPLSHTSFFFPTFPYSSPLPRPGAFTAPRCPRAQRCSPSSNYASPPRAPLASAS